MSEERTARAGGWAAIIAGVVGAAAAVVLIVMRPMVDDDVFSYPLSGLGFTLVQIAFFLHHLVAAFALYAFWRAGLAGRGRAAMIAGVVSTVLMGLLAVQELVSIPFADAAYPSPETDAVESAYGVLTLALGAALVTLGLVGARAGTLSGAARWVMLLIGVYVFVPLTPAIFGPFLVGRLAIGVWLLLFVWLGAVMIRWSHRSVGTSATRLTAHAG